MAVTPNNKPHLIAVVDTEEEFEWEQPFSRSATSVRHMEQVGKLQSLFDRHSIEPIYVVDYPIASQPSAYRVLRELVEGKRAHVGAHLHPWVTPP